MNGDRGEVLMDGEVGSSVMGTASGRRNDTVKIQTPERVKEWKERYNCAADYHIARAACNA